MRIRQKAGAIFTYGMPAFLFSLVFAVGCVANRRTSTNQTNERPKNSSENLESLKSLNAHHIRAVYSWDGAQEEGDTLNCLVTVVDNGGTNERREKLVITNSAGDSLYERTSSEFERIYQVEALRGQTSQLAIEYNEGGHDSFLQLLNCNNGKLSELLQEPGNDFVIHALIQPQDRTGVNRSTEPFEVLLTQGATGLPGAGEFDTKIFRFDGKSYVSVGSFAFKDINDEAEKLLKTDRRGR